MRQVRTEELSGPDAVVDAEVLEFRSQFGQTSPLDELVRHGAQQMLQTAIEAEVDEDGTKVAVSVEPRRDETATGAQFPSLYDRLKSVAGRAEGLPTDLAINHDHYLHGQPKRQ